MNSLLDTVPAAVAASTDVVIDRDRVQSILSLIDLTSLGETDTPHDIKTLCQKALTPVGPVAAVCVYPRFVRQAVTDLAAAQLPVATVVNFHSGNEPLPGVVKITKQALQDGATEIDLVFPYERYLAGDIDGAMAYVHACREVCGPLVSLKVILETGAIADLAIIASISQAVLRAGADFLKTSTGKVPVGATLEAAAVMLFSIRDLQAESMRSYGFKASGGVRTVMQAAQYLALAEHILGAEWVSAQTFRFGASQLLDAALQTL